MVKRSTHGLMRGIGVLRVGRMAEAGIYFEQNIDGMLIDWV